MSKVVIGMIPQLERLFEVGISLKQTAVGQLGVIGFTKAVALPTLYPLSLYKKLGADPSCLKFWLCALGTQPMLYPYPAKRRYILGNTSQDIS